MYSEEQPTLGKPGVDVYCVFSCGEKRSGSARTTPTNKQTLFPNALLDWGHSSLRGVPFLRFFLRFSVSPFLRFFAFFKPSKRDVVSMQRVCKYFQARHQPHTSPEDVPPAPRYPSCQWASFADDPSRSIGERRQVHEICIYAPRQCLGCHDCLSIDLSRLQRRRGFESKRTARLWQSCK